jgi:hypothetical protein
VALIDEALRVAAADRPRWDAVVAERSGWPVEVVRAVADRNRVLSGRGGVGELDRAALARALAFARMPNLTLETLFAPELLDGARPLARAAGKGPPKGVVPPPGMGPPQGPPPGAPGGPNANFPPGPPSPDSPVPPPPTNPPPIASPGSPASPVSQDGTGG